MEFQEYLSHISLAQKEGRHPSPLNRIYPFMDELMKSVRNGDVDPWEVKNELPSKLKWFVGELQRIEQIKGNRQHYMYAYFSRLLMKYYAIHDPSVPEPKAVNPRLKLIKG